MRKLHCPQCSVANLYIKNEKGERRLVFVTPEYVVVASKEGESLDGFDTETLYCLGCSWSGTAKRLTKY